MPDIPELDDSVLAGVRPAPQESRGHRLALLLLGPLTAFFLAIVIVFYVLFAAIRVDGESMLPNFHDTDRVLITRSYPTPHRGDVVAASIPTENGGKERVIKRVVAVAGDLVEIRADVAYINGKREDYAPIVLVEGTGVDVPAQRVGTDHVYLLGDNRPISLDSRFIGPVSEDDISGKAVAIFAPIQRARRIR